MSDQNLIFAKIVATPSPTSWSQAYNAGKLFAVLSLVREQSNPESPPLGLIGKEILEALEQEYFTLEEKNLDSIKEAIRKTYEKTPQDINICMVIASITQNVLYVFSLGKSAALLKREENLGDILVGSEDSRQLRSASGFLNPGDTLVLQTEKFASLVNKDTLIKTMNSNSPSDIAESLSPLIHNTQEGAASAIILTFNQEEIPIKPPIEPEASTPVTTEKKSFKYLSWHKIKSLIPHKLPALPFTPKFSYPNLPNLSTSRKLLLILSIVFLTILVLAILFTIKQKENAQRQTILSEALDEAQKKYDEGVALASLNKALALEDFRQAEKILKEGKKKLPKDSQEAKKIDDFLTKIEATLAQSENINKPDALAAQENESLMLTYALKNPTKFTAQNQTHIFAVDSQAVSSIDKQSSKTEKIITNKDDWKEPVALGTYLNNLYILDKKTNQIIKFAPSADDYSKSSYLKTNIDLSSASSLAIDGSVYVLLQNGTIYKFTRGEKDSFSVTGLTQALAKPTRIFTNSETEKIYILDPESSRIVVLEKSAVYHSQYSTEILKDAKEFEVLEKEKSIFVLSKDRLWKIPLK